MQRYTVAWDTSLNQFVAVSAETAQDAQLHVNAFRQRLSAEDGGQGVGRFSGLRPLTRDEYDGQYPIPFDRLPTVEQFVEQRRHAR